MELKANEKGQTVVEYILLLSVAVSLVLTFYRSAAFKRLFGENGKVGGQIKSQNEFSYRHAYSRNRPTADIDRNNKDIGQHPSYADLNEGGSRFFGPKGAYPTGQ
jgi:Flp pilus assembly pilin Flp